jgi:hypothetical protein
MSRSSSGFTNSPVDYGTTSLYPVHENMSFSPDEIMHYSMDQQDGCQSQPWTQFDQRAMPRVMMPSAGYTMQSPMQSWVDMPTPYDSQPLSEASSFLYTPSTPSLVDVDSAPSMSRGGSHASNFSTDFVASHQMTRMDSALSNYSCAPEPALDPYLSCQENSQFGLPMDNMMHMRRDSQQYLAPPATQAGKVRLDRQQVNRPSPSSPASSSASLRRYSAGSGANRFLCEECDERPQGFRGEHELTRHIKLRHAVVRSMWMCVYPRHHPLYLENCKQCMDKKKYGAYYNAVQHIRRCHVSPTKRGRKSKSEALAAKAKGANSSTGERDRNWPDMPEMKKFLVEVLVDRDENVLDEANLSPEVIARAKTGKAAHVKNGVKKEQDDQLIMDFGGSVDMDMDAEGEDVSDEDNTCFEFPQDPSHQMSPIDHFGTLSQTHLLQGVDPIGYHMPVDKSMSFEIDFDAFQ